MKEQKAKTASKITHPMAKYNSLNQLMCVICSVHVKTEILWPTHLQSKKHKETVATLKNEALLEKPVQPVHPAKPIHEMVMELDEDDITTTTTLKRGSDEAGRDDSVTKKQKVEQPSSSSIATESTLPSDFFDPKALKNDDGDDDDGDEDKVIEGIVPDDETPKKNNKRSQDTKNDAALPEGFFDDPKMDAKARKVEYKDPMTEEWEKFQKSIAKETDTSEALVQAADEETNEDKELNEVNEQVACFKRAEALRLKQEEWLSKKAMTSKDQEMREDGEEGDGDDVDIDEIMNWRSKVA